MLCLVECLLEISQNIIDILGADGQTDGALMDTLILQLLCGQLQ